MRNRTFLLILGLFFMLDGLLFVGKSIWRGVWFYAIDGSVFLAAGAMILTARRMTRSVR